MMPTSLYEPARARLYLGRRLALAKIDRRIGAQYRSQPIASAKRGANDIAIRAEGFTQRGNLNFDGRRAETGLRASEESRRKLFENSSAGIALALNGNVHRGKLGATGDARPKQAFQ